MTKPELLNQELKKQKRLNQKKIKIGLELIVLNNKIDFLQEEIKGKDNNSLVITQEFIDLLITGYNNCKKIGFNCIVCDFWLDEDKFFCNLTIDSINFLQKLVKTQNSSGVNE